MLIKTAFAGARSASTVPTHGATAFFAIACGYAVVVGGGHATAAVGLLILAGYALVVAVRPRVGFIVLALLLGGYSEVSQENLLPAARVIYGRGSRIAFAEIALFVLLGALVVTGQRRLPRVAAPALLLAAIAVLHIAGRADIHPIRPLFILCAALCCGFWLAHDYGRELVLRGMLASGGIAALLGLINHFAGRGVAARGEILSSYDSASIFLVGVAALILWFEPDVLPIGRLPRTLLIGVALADIVFSLRRGAIGGLLLAAVVTVLARRDLRRQLVVIVFVPAALALAGAIAMPGVGGRRVQVVVRYFNVTTGDNSYHYRAHEVSNVLQNIHSHWLWGIGPSASWHLYNTYGDTYLPPNTQYAHNEFLAMWLRYGLIGFALAISFFVVVAVALWRRWALGAGIAIGIAFACLTASFLTTTSRWPLLVGLLLGAGLGPRGVDGAQRVDPARLHAERNVAASVRHGRDSIRSGDC